MFSCLFQGTDTIEAHYPNISRPYRPRREQCSQISHRTRYSTEPGPGWGGGTPLQDIESNHIEGAARSKISRSSSPSREESMSLSGSTSQARLNVFVLVGSVLWAVVCWKWESVGVDCGDNQETVILRLREHWVIVWYQLHEILLKTYFLYRSFELEKICDEHLDDNSIQWYILIFALKIMAFQTKRCLDCKSVNNIYRSLFFWAWPEFMTSFVCPYFRTRVIVVWCNYANTSWCTVH